MIAGSCLWNSLSALNVYVSSKLGSLNSLAFNSVIVEMPNEHTASHAALAAVAMQRYRAN